MDIHKPKAAHSFREFVTELFTIVLGIVIAIGLEQTVEYFHWKHEVEAGRELLHAEIAASNTIFAFRVMAAPCIDRQLDGAESTIRASASGHWTAPPKTRWIGPDFMILNSAWLSEQSSQILTHFPRAELAVLNTYYFQVSSFHDWENQELIAWSGLNVLNDNPGAADLAQLRLNLYHARYLQFLIELNARRQLAYSAQLGIKYSLPPRWMLMLHCKPGEWLKAPG